MKKRLCMLLIAALLLLLPHAASANAPIPWYIEISCENVEEGTQIEVVFQREDGTTRTEIADRTTGTIGMGYESDETSFCLVCTAPDGTETRTESVQLVSWGSYRYDGATNSLSANGTYYPRGSNCADGVFTVVLIVLAIVLPLGLTLLFEFLVALCFGIRPKKYVCIINLITNPVMNVLLFLLGAFNPNPWLYYTALGVLELVAVAVEFLFYRKKYPQYGGARLFFFSLTANAVSFALGCGVLYLLL